MSYRGVASCSTYQYHPDSMQFLSKDFIKPLHREVTGEDLGREAQEPLPLHEVGEIGEELAADPLALEAVSYD